MFSTNLLRFLPVMALAAVLSSCGGGSGGGEGEPDASQVTGSLSPIPLRGLAYSTETSSGTTNASGEYYYREGETLEFRLGETVLGTARGAETLTLFELAGAPALTEVTEIDDVLESDGNAYTAAVNLIRLLHSLDRDLDAGNGIEIDEETLALFDGVDVRFDELPRVFAGSAPIRDLMVGLDRSLMKLEVPLALQFQASDTQLTVNGVRLSRRLSEENIPLSDAAPLDFLRTEITYDNLGNRLTRASYGPDRNLQSRSAYSYDEGGLGIAAEHDTNGDGQLDTRSTTVREASGNTKSTVQRYGASLQNVVRYTDFYNEKGFRVRREEDRGDDGSIDAYYRTQYLDNGKSARAEADTDGDGVVDQMVTSSYDAAGRLVLSTFEGKGLDLIGELEGRPPSLGYGAGDSFDPTAPYPDVTSFGVIGGIPGQVTTRETAFSWNAAGYLTRRASDTDNDGRADRVSEFTYDGDRLVAWRQDKDGDGVFESFAQYSYSATGLLVEVTQTDGRFQFVSSEKRELFHDASGRVERVVVDSNGFGANDGERRFSYDTLGNIREVLYDIDLDGSADARSVSEWEPSYRLDDWEFFGH